jgi:hypothetical protein
MVGGGGEFPCVSAGHLVHQPGPAELQSAAHLSTGWRPDSSVSSVVCAGPRSKPHGGCQHRIHWRSRTHCPGDMDTLGLVRCSVLLHLDELLGRTKTGASFIPSGKVAATRRVCLSLLQDGATNRSVLEVRPMRPTLRHFSNAGCLPKVQCQIYSDRVSGLPESISHNNVILSDSEESMHFREYIDPLPAAPQCRSASAVPSTP